MLSPKQPEGMSQGLIAPLVALALMVFLVQVLFCVGGVLLAFSKGKELAKTEQDGLAALRSLHGSDIVKIAVSEGISRPLTIMAVPWSRVRCFRVWRQGA
jgi:hypothetical protein